MTNTTTEVACTDDAEEERPDENALITSIVEALGRSNEQAYKRYKHGWVRRAA